MKQNWELFKNSQLRVLTILSTNQLDPVDICKTLYPKLWNIYS